MIRWELIALQRNEESSAFLILSNKGIFYEFEFKNPKSVWFTGKKLRIKKTDLNSKEVKELFKTDVESQLEKGDELNLALWNIVNAVKIHFPEALL